MSKYIIRPTRKGFGVYHGRTILGRMKLIADHERLWDAEMQTLHLVTQDYHRQLDYRRTANQIMSTDMMEPRVNEEHIYTALCLAGKKPENADEHNEFAPRSRGNEDDYTKYDNILEPHLGKPISQVARVMFEERFMSWYAEHNPEWIDPRREREYIPAQDRMGRNRYSTRGGLTQAAPPTPTAVKRWLASLSQRATLIRRAIFGTAFTEEDIKRAAAAMDAQAVPQTGRSIR